MSKPDQVLAGFVEQMADVAKSQYPPCFLANEIGALAVHTKSAEAVRALCAMLNDKRPEVQYAAYGYLSIDLSDQPGVKESIAAFEANAKNAEVVETLRRSASGTLSIN
ncbi:MAG: hypothetical protein P4L67_02700 [Candidatus Pacebacteria bacterium]|nr:hypothetical protein [Candidatus Paceibacterota bacterium]